MTFRICTFNAAGRSGGWDFVKRRVEPDLVLLQESWARDWPGAFMPVQLVADRTTVGGTAIFSPVARLEPLNLLERSLIGCSSPAGTVTAAVVTPRNLRSFVAVSIYVRIDNNLAYPNAVRVVDDLERLIEASSGRLVIGGDFNAWDQKNNNKTNDRWRIRWQSLWSRLEELGMVNLLRHTAGSRVPMEGCGCGLVDCYHVKTVRRSSNMLTDYLWTTPDLARGCKVGVMDIDDDELRRVSDHSPVWTDLAV